MQVFPIVSTVNGRIVAATSTEPNAEMLAAAIDRANGSPLVRLGEPFPVNPSWAKSRAPEAVPGFVAAAKESVNRATPDPVGA